MPTDLRTPYYEKALDILGAEGYAGLKQAAVCRAMGVTTGAFYHSFENWKEFTGLLLEFWRDERTTSLVALALAEADPVDQLLVLLEVAVQLPHRAEAAIRVWSALDADVAKVQEAVDDERFTVIRDAFVMLAVRAEDAESYARTAMALLIGFEQQPDADPAILRWGLELLLSTVRG